HAQACELCDPSLVPPLVLPFVSCLLALAGVALAAWGIGIVNGLQWIEPLPAIVQDKLPGFLFPDPQLVVVGGAMALAGALLAGLLARRALSDPLAGLALPIPRLRFDILALGAILAAALCVGL